MAYDEHLSKTTTELANSHDSRTSERDRPQPLRGRTATEATAKVAREPINIGARMRRMWS